MNDEALSALDWWALAGVDTLVEDSPRDWFAKAVPAAPVAPPPAPIVAAPPPTDLASIRAAIVALAVPGAGDERLAPEGDPAAGLMLLLDMPEGEDALEGRLLTGATGRLLDRMLGAIGRDRASIYLATILPARPAGGQFDPAAHAAAIDLAHAHIALAAPRAVLLCGDGACRAMLATGLLAARGRLQTIDHNAARTPAVATFHPCRLLDHPAQKAGAWQDLRLLLGELG